MFEELLHKPYWTISLYSCALRIIIYKTPMRENGCVSEWTCCALCIFPCVESQNARRITVAIFPGRRLSLSLDSPRFKNHVDPPSRAVCDVLNHQKVSVHLAISTNIRKLLTALWNWTVETHYRGILLDILCLLHKPVIVVCCLEVLHKSSRMIFHFKSYTSTNV